MKGSDSARFGRRGAASTRGSNRREAHDHVGDPGAHECLLRRLRTRPRPRGLRRGQDRLAPLRRDGAGAVPRARSRGTRDRAARARRPGRLPPPSLPGEVAYAARTGALRLPLLPGRAGSTARCSPATKLEHAPNAAPAAASRAERRELLVVHRRIRFYGLPILGSHLMTCSRPPPPPRQRCTICVCGFRKGKRTRGLGRERMIHPAKLAALRPTLRARGGAESSPLAL